MDEHEEMLERHPAYKNAYFGNFKNNPDYNLIVRRRNKFAEITNLKEWQRYGSKLYEAIYHDSVKKDYDHHEFYKCTIDYERRYMIMFHNYDVSDAMYKKYIEAGFQHLPVMYHAWAKSFQANSSSIEGLAKIILDPFRVKLSKDIAVELFDEVVS